jgi:hypothetical protein
MPPTCHLSVRPRRTAIIAVARAATAVAGAVHRRPQSAKTASSALKSLVPTRSLGGRESYMGGRESYLGGRRTSTSRKVPHSHLESSARSQLVVTPRRWTCCFELNQIQRCTIIARRLGYAYVEMCECTSRIERAMPALCIAEAYQPWR